MGKVNAYSFVGPCSTGKPRIPALRQMNGSLPGASNRPSFLGLDETLSGLDNTTVHHCIRALQQSGAALLVCGHRNLHFPTATRLRLVETDGKPQVAARQQLHSTIRASIAYHPHNALEGQGANGTTQWPHKFSCQFFRRLSRLARCWVASVVRLRLCCMAP